MNQNQSKNVVEESNVITGLDAVDSSDVIQKLGQLLIKGSFVHETYIQAVIDREKTFPTGLRTVSGYVAIPHADSTFVKKTGIAIATLSQPVTFKSMENGSDEYPVTLVMLLAIKDVEEVVKVLQKVIALLENEEALSKVQSASNPKIIQEIFQHHMETFQEE